MYLIRSIGENFWTVWIRKLKSIGDLFKKEVGLKIYYLLIIIDIIIALTYIVLLDICK